MWFFNIIDENSEIVFSEKFNIEFISNSIKSLVSSICISNRKLNISENIDLSENFCNFVKHYYYKNDFSIYFNLGMTIFQDEFAFSIKDYTINYRNLCNSIYFSIISLIGYKELHKKEGNLGGKKEVK